MLVLFKKLHEFFKVSIFEYFFKEYNRLLFKKKKKKKNSQYIMIESLSLKEENIIADIRNLFRLNKKLNYTTIKDIRNLFRLKKRN